MAVSPSSADSTLLSLSISPAVKPVCPVSLSNSEPSPTPVFSPSNNRREESGGKGVESREKGEEPGTMMMEEVEGSGGKGVEPGDEGEESETAGEGLREKAEGSGKTAQEDVMRMTRARSRQIVNNATREFNVQWTPFNPATLGTSQSVLIRGVASFSGVDWYYTVDSL